MRVCVDHILRLSFNTQSVDFHERGKRHQENVKKLLSSVSSMLVYRAVDPLLYRCTYMYACGKDV